MRVAMESRRLGNATLPLEGESDLGKALEVCPMANVTYQDLLLRRYMYVVTNSRQSNIYLYLLTVPKCQLNYRIIQYSYTISK